MERPLPLTWENIVLLDLKKDDIATKSAPFFHIVVIITYG